MVKYNIQLMLFILADIVVWFGGFFLNYRSLQRNAAKKGNKPNLKKEWLVFIILWLVIHGIELWMAIEFKKWGGPP